MSVKEQLQQEADAVTASPSGGLQDGSAGEDDEEDEVVALDDSSPVDLSQFGKAFKVCGEWQYALCSHQPVVANGMGYRRGGRECYIAEFLVASVRDAQMQICSFETSFYQYLTIPCKWPSFILQLLFLTVRQSEVVQC